MTIKEVAIKFNINESTLRYYEQEQLIDKVDKLKNGHRNYNDENIKQIEFVCILRDAQTPIQVIKEYIKLSKMGDNYKKQRIAILKNEKHKIDIQIKKLKQASKILNNKIQSNNY